MRSVGRAGAWLQGAGAALQARLTDAVTPSPPASASVRAWCLLQHVMHMLAVGCYAIGKIKKSNYGLLEVRRTNNIIDTLHDAALAQRLGLNSICQGICRPLWAYEVRICKFTFQTSVQDGRPCCTKERYLVRAGRRRRL